MCKTLEVMRRRLEVCLLLTPLLACVPVYGKGERGTTRHCAPEDDTQLAVACYRQCADPAGPDCKVVRKDGDENPEVPECLRDGTGAYLVEDDALVPPSGSDECFAMLDDADGSSDETGDDLSSDCVDVGANLEFVLTRKESATVPEGVCYDFNCKVSADADADCPDLE